MCGEDSQDYSSGDILGNGEYIEVGVEVEVERSGAPDLAPAGGEDLRAGTILGGKKGDDVSEDGVREAADLGDVLFLFRKFPPLGSEDHLHYGMVVRWLIGLGKCWTNEKWYLGIAHNTKPNKTPAN